jgi:hypothetical protein
MCKTLYNALNVIHTSLPGLKYRPSSLLHNLSLALRIVISYMSLLYCMTLQPIFYLMIKVSDCLFILQPGPYAMNISLLCLLHEALIS